MPNRLVFLSVSDARGDIDLVARAIAHAQSKDVGAAGVFFIGNFAGPLLSGAELLSLETARRTLQTELRERESLYKDEGVLGVWGLVDHMAANSERYRRGAEVNAVNAWRHLLGRRDARGKFVELGIAARKAKAIYAQAAKLFSKAKVPCYLMADTLFAEDVPETNWLHFSWVSLSGFAVRCLGASEVNDPQAVPEFYAGPRRGGRLVRLENYPFSSADIVFAYVLSPVLHEMLSTHERKLVVMPGDGQIDVSYARNVCATQRPRIAYAYTLDGAKVLRRSYTFEKGAFVEEKLEEGQESQSTTRFGRRAGGSTKRAEVETQAKLAGLGADLVRFVDLLRMENPDLANQMEQAESRAEAIYRYVQYLEQQRSALRATISAERAGFERLLSKVAGFLPADAAARIAELSKTRPDVSAAVEALDQANLAVAEAVEAGLAQRLGAPAPPPPATPAPAVEVEAAAPPVEPAPEPVVEGPLLSQLMSSVEAPVPPPANGVEEPKPAPEGEAQ